MLVTFHTKAYADITMFGDVAKELLHLMGHSGTVPSALKAEDVPAALGRLESAIAEHKGSEAPEAAATAAKAGRDRGRDDEAPRKVPLSHRALPLVELLRSAARQKADVMWDSRAR
jgi:hypothetical protein